VTESSGEFCEQLGLLEWLNELNLSQTVGRCHDANEVSEIESKHWTSVRNSYALTSIMPTSVRQVKLLITNNLFCIVQRETAQSIQGIIHG
jgi:hypothetical protein